MATSTELRAKLAHLRRLRDEAEHDWDALSRPAQREPEGEWSTWCILAGRGFGKSRALSEALRRRVRLGTSRESAIVASTAADVRDVMVTGPSGVLAVCTDAERPTYEPSLRRLSWPNGAITHLYSADEPERLRGPQHDFAIGDELRGWRRLEEAIDNLLLGLRMGSDPRFVCATTPSGRPELRALLQRSGTVVTSGSTHENLPNLPAAFKDRVVDLFEGSRIAEQELYGRFIDELPDALFKRAWLDEHRVEGLPHPSNLKRTVVALDPSDGNATSDEAAICVATLDHSGHIYIVRSEGHRISPLQYLKRSVRLAVEHDGSIVAERNFGGRPLLELLEQAMRDCGVRVPYQHVHVHESKALRIQPLSVLAEQGRLHLIGHHPELEAQMTTFTGARGERSPDRLDSAAHAVRTLAGYGLGGDTGVAGRAVPYTVKPRGVEGAAVPWEGDPVGGLFAPVEELRGSPPQRVRSLQAEREPDPNELAWLSSGLRVRC
ncbi:MAG: terminase family protein [Actinomycetota bacterium]